MTKTTLKNLAEEAIVLLREMFGEGVEFECIEHFKTNEALTGIALKLPGCTAIPTVNLNDMPDNATAEDIANMHIPDREPRLHGVLAPPCRKGAPLFHEQF